MIPVAVIVFVVIISGEFIKFCYKFIVGIVIMVVIKGKRKHARPSGEYNYDNYIIISYDSDFTCIITVMDYSDDTTINENKNNDEVSDEIYYLGVIVHIDINLRW